MDLHETRRFVAFLTAEVLAHAAHCTKASDETAADVAREVLDQTAFSVGIALRQAEEAAMAAAAEEFLASQRALEREPAACAA